MTKILCYFWIKPVSIIFNYYYIYKHIHQAILEQMKHLLQRLILVLVVFSTLTSCSKDEPTPDYDKLLTAHTWKYGSARMETTDAYLLQQKGFLLTLTQTTEITFNSDGTYEGSEGTGTWELSEDKTKILFNQNSSSKWFWPIRDLTSNSLKVSWTIHAADADLKMHEGKIYIDLIPKH
jgi:hypothetical protein